jgi:hypothetical protein
MNLKSLFVFALVVGAVVWIVLKDDVAPKPKPTSLTATQQQQMQKAAKVGDEMQESLDKRMQDSAVK